MQVRAVLFFLIILPVISFGQTLGGSSVYNFLKLPASALLTATGGVNVSLSPKDAGFCQNNPATITPANDRQLSLNFNGFFAGIRSYQLATVLNDEKLKTCFGAGVFFVDYGSIPQTDASGNQNGSFHPRDFVIQVSGSKQYLEKWRYGANLKFISSAYQQYHSSAIGVDVGVLFNDTSKLFSAGLTVKNMGFQVKTYDQSREELPFDLEFGVTKKLAKAPFGFSFTAQQVHRFNTDYNDSIFNNENGFPHRSTFAVKLINHLVLAAHVYAGQNLEIHLGYNFLRRNELNLGSSGNGLNGFSTGFKAKFSKFEFQYARAYYQRNMAYNQLGINLNMQKLFGSGSL
jgi:hypothetical protein